MIPKHGQAAAHAERPEPLRPAQSAPPLHLEVGRRLWEEIPTLSWTLDLASGRLQPVGPQQVLSMDDPQALAAKLLRYFGQNGRGPFRLLDTLLGKDGSLRDFLIVGFPFGGDAAAPAAMGGVAIDITHYKIRVDELAHQALVDELTGLYNLRGFMLFGEHELKVARRRGTRSAILYVDVDGLKQINDAHGHQRGSALLVATAALLRRVFRECDVIARLGGDEFAVFAAEVNGDPAQLRQRLYRAAADALPAFAVSAGVGSFPPDPDLKLTDLLTAADQAMYKDKVEKTGRPLGAASATGGAPGG
jgi:diguanylate cyclase (GGDEF)-like protein